MTNLERYHARRRIGLCGRLGCQTWSDEKSLCPRHLEAQRVRGAMYRRVKRYEELRQRRDQKREGL